MSLSNTHPVGASDYDALRLAIIGLLEGNKPLPYFDTAKPRQVTIGIGFNISDKSVRDSVFARMGINILSAVATNLANVITSGTYNGQLIANLPAGGGPGARDYELRAALDRAFGGSFAMTPQQIADEFVSQATARQNAITVSTGVPTNTLEMIALLSAQYTGVFGPNIKAAIQNDKRAEAWFELRYASNADTKHTMRRYLESELFGLYDNNGVSTTDAKDIYSMLTKHRNEMLQYEQTYQSKIADANLAYANGSIVAAFAGAGIPVPTVRSLGAELIDARDVFVAWLNGQLPAGASPVALGWDPLAIYYNPDSPVVDARVLAGGAVNTTPSLLVGTDGKSNILYGGGGADTLVGGINGADHLHGGGGNDTLMGRGAGAGSFERLYGEADFDTCIYADDNDGQIVFDGVTLAPLFPSMYTDPAHKSSPAWSWSQNGKTFYAVLLDGDLTTGGTLQIRSDSSAAADQLLIEQFKPGDLGLNLSMIFQTAITVGGNTATSAFTPGAQPTVASTDLREGFHRAFNFYVSAPSTAPQQVKFAMAGINGDAGLLLGDQIVQFGPDGTVTVTLAPGQTAASFALVSQTDIDADRDLQLTATLVDSQGTAFGTASALNVHLAAKNETDGSADTVYTYDNVLGTTVTGLFTTTPTGNGYWSWTISAQPGFQPEPIYSSEIMDLSLAAPVGIANALEAVGGLGDSHLIGGSYRNSLFDGWNAYPFQYSGPTGDNDLLVGAAFDDVLQTHGGDDRSYGGAGNDLIIDTPLGDLSEGYGSTAWVDAAGHSNRDRLYGEAGYDIIVAGAGDGYLYGGAGNDTLIGGTGDDVLSGDSRQSGMLYNNVSVPGGAVLITGIFIEDRDARGRWPTKVAERGHRIAGAATDGQWHALSAGGAYETRSQNCQRQVQSVTAFFSPAQRMTHESRRGELDGLSGDLK
jgi:Ca2+-binding RTX toxin-like protein